MKKFIKKYGLTVLLIIAIISTYAITTFADTQWATVSGFNYPDGLNTTEEATQAISDFSAAGYYPINFSNASAQSIYTDLPTTSIWFFSGHGDAGALNCWNGSTETHIYAFGASGLQNGILGNYYLNKSSSLSKIKVAVFGGCNTGNTGLPGNLLTEATAKGVQFCIGWTTTTLEEQHRFWLEHFTNYLENRYCVSQAWSMADDDVEDEYSLPWETTGGTLNHTFQGNYMIRITPSI